MEFMNNPTTQLPKCPAEKNESKELYTTARQIIMEVVHVPLSAAAQEKLEKEIVTALHSKCEEHEIREIIAPDGNTETTASLLQRLILGWELEDLKWLAHEVPNRFFFFCLHGMQAGLNLEDTKKCLEFAIKHAPKMGVPKVAAVAIKQIILINER